MGKRWCSMVEWVKRYFLQWFERRGVDGWVRGGGVWEKGQKVQGRVLSL